MIRGAVSAMLFMGLVVGVLSYRLLIDGKRYWEEAEQASNEAVAWKKVVSRYEDAAKTYFPGNPYPERALWKLSLMAKSAQMRGEEARTRYIWEVVRRSAVSQRHVFQPYSSYVRQARVQLAAMNPASPATVDSTMGLASASTTTVPKSTAKDTIKNATTESVNDGFQTDDGLEDSGIFATLLLFLGLVGWIVAASVGIFSKGKKAAFYFGASFLGMILWIVAAWMA